MENDFEKMRLFSWWCGVDPGTESKVQTRMGMLCFLSEDFNKIHFIPCHQIKACQNALKALRHNILGVVIEDVSPHFSKPYGDAMRWHDRCLWLDLRHAMLHPAKWQKMLAEHKKKGDKRSSIEFVRARHPGVLADAVGEHTGKADAVVLAMWAEVLFGMKKMQG